MTYEAFLENYDWADDVMFYGGFLMRRSNAWYIKNKDDEVSSLLIRVGAAYYEFSTNKNVKGWSYISRLEQNEIDKFLSDEGVTFLKSEIEMGIWEVQNGMTKVKKKMEAYGDWV